MKTKLITTKLVVVSLVSIAVVLISLNAGGGLEPDAPPGPTMHTLEDIYNLVSAANEPTPEPFAFDCFLKIDGIPGESTDAKHKDWIEVLSYNHSVTMPVTTLIGADGGRTAGQCEHQDFSVVKEMDKATPNLALFCCTGERVTTPEQPIRLELCKASGEKLKFMEYVLHDVIVTYVKPKGDPRTGEILPVEEVTFNYGKIEWTYTDLDGKGNDVMTYWDVMANKGG